MKSFFLSLFTLAMLAINVTGSHAATNDFFQPNEHNYYHPDGPKGSFPDRYPYPNESFHPQSTDYYDDNLRYQLKKRADIERASAPTVHYSQQANDYYQCDWQYNKNLGTWVCNKDSLDKSNNTNIPTCSFGYQLNPWKTGCDRIQIPPNATLNSQGNGWDCVSGYRMNSAYTGCIAYSNIVYEPVNVYVQPVNTVRYVYLDEPAKPIKLAATGPNMNLLLIGLSFVIFVGIKGIKFTLVK